MNTPIQVYQLVVPDPGTGAAVTLCASADYTDIQITIAWALGSGGWTLSELRVDTWEAGKRVREDWQGGRS